MQQSKDESNDLPDVIAVHDFDAAWQVFMQLEAVDWKHLPVAGGLNDQPEALWNDVLTIASVARRIRKILDKPPTKSDAVISE